LARRELGRARGIPARRALTDVIRDCLPDTPHKARYYKIYTDLAYKAATGACAARIRKERGAPPGADAADYMTSDELEAVRVKEGQIAALIEAGMGYAEIRDILLRGVAGTGKE
ncbi:MAG: Rha family transcriptional regulator, partial [Oscillibacter sp.]|nr:Rha family transcriptional regulator [Oscillibacter sp.]